MLDWMPSALDHGKPRYIAIADAIAADIQAGVLTTGTRLPPQRRLAAELGIDFTTVSRAYAEAQARGHVQSHVGRGTFVKGRIATTHPDPARQRSRLRQLMQRMRCGKVLDSVLNLALACGSSPCRHIAFHWHYFWMNHRFTRRSKGSLQRI